MATTLYLRANGIGGPDEWWTTRSVGGVQQDPVSGDTLDLNGFLLSLGYEDDSFPGSTGLLFYITDESAGTLGSVASDKSLRGALFVERVSWTQSAGASIFLSLSNFASFTLAPNQQLSGYAVVENGGELVFSTFTGGPYPIPSRLAGVVVCREGGIIDFNGITEYGGTIISEAGTITFGANSVEQGAPVICESGGTITVNATAIIAEVFMAYTGASVTGYTPLDMGSELRTIRYEGDIATEAITTLEATPKTLVNASIVVAADKVLKDEPRWDGATGEGFVGTLEQSVVGGGILNV